MATVKQKKIKIKNEIASFDAFDLSNENVGLYLIAVKPQDFPEAAGAGSAVASGGFLRDGAFVRGVGEVAGGPDGDGD